MSKPTTTELIQAIRAATATERKAILEAIGQQPSGPVHTAASIAANVESLRQVFEVLSEQQATALLSSSGLQVWGVVEGDLVELLTPYVDGHWEALESELGRAVLLCGEYGRRVLGKVESRVRKARRSRGAAEIAQVSVLLEMARAAAMAEAKAGEGVDGAAEGEAARIYESLLAEYAGALGSDGSGFVFGAFTAGDLAMLRACKRYVERHEPHLMAGDWKTLNERLAGLFGRARETGMDPETRMREREIRWERRQQPHVLFPGLRKGEEAKWGGYLRNVDGRADDGSGVWGGGRDFGEMERAMRVWMEGRAREKGIDSGLRNAGHLLP